ncbi:protein-disulfide reductase DsbD [Psychrobacter aestuarii]|uniref:Protein-disulfide reductase n=1 Tax=Psychrobacter aestuarii TaxID=556327 RepID=A0ABN0VK81_9GAMM|nr:protein-disulfide reductase DsbD [Psychrobacter aestuarii]
MRSQQSTVSSNHTMPVKLSLRRYAASAVTAVLLIGSVVPSANAVSLGELFGTQQQSSTPQFLPVDEAFSVIASDALTDEGTEIRVSFDITPEHYVYKDRLQLNLPEGVVAGAWQFNQTANSIDDPQFGRVPVFDQTAVTATAILRTDDGQGMSNVPISIQWQGCAKAGLCYPPETVTTRVTIAPTPAQASPLVTANTSSNDNNATNAAPSAQTLNTTNTADSAAPIATDAANTASTDAAQTTVSTATTSTPTDAAAVPQDIFGLAAHPFLGMLLLFVAGLGLALTPCVLPMLPIVANIVARQTNPTLKKSLLLTTSYALGVAIAYGLLGALIAYFGVALGIMGWLQNPVILVGFAAVFVLLGLYMLGVFNVRLPSTLTRKMQSLSQAGDAYLGSTGGSLVAGFLSALVVSPCVSAPLSGALTAVSTIGSPLLGFAALFMLGFGLSVPLIVIGATQGKVMPKAGVWMDWVKQGFALLLFAVALLLLERVFISSMMLMVWALWFMVTALWAWRWVGRGRLLTQAFALVVGLWSACVVVGAALGNTDVLNPLASVTSNQGSATTDSAINEVTVTTLAELDTIVQANERVLVDVTADWCVECRIMDKNLFHNPPAQMQGWQLVRLDITDTTPESKAILARYQLFGPPALLYYSAGQLVTQQTGEVKRDTFEQTLTQLN